MEISLHHIPKLLKVPSGEYNSLHPLYSVAKITSNLEYADNLTALEAETKTEIEIDQSTGTQGYATLLIRSDNERLVGRFCAVSPGRSPGVGNSCDLYQGFYGGREISFIS